MKKNLAFFNLLLTASSAVVIIFAANAFASDNFYIEIGEPTSVEKTKEQWQVLSEKYKSTLGKLTFYPKSIINPEGENTSIIQAGPITEKDTAQKICNKLFAKDIPCFVIEGIEEAPPTMAMDISQAASDSSKTATIFPWQTAESTPQAIAEAEETYPPAPEAEVAVAQAIAVPLSSEASNKIQINEPPELKPVKNPKPFPEARPFPDNQQQIEMPPRTRFPKEFRSRESGSLIIETFSSEAVANQFWSSAKNELPDLEDNLHVQIQRPLLSTEQGGVQIRIYPFPDGESAKAFCKITANTFDAALKCSYEISNAPTSTSALAQENYQHSDAYEERRQTLQRRAPAQQAEIQELPATRNFWAQVAIADSKDEATHRWDEIRKKNSATVRDISSQLIYSASAYAKYSIRLGSFDSEREANELCNKLQARGVDCLVVSKNN